MGLTVAYVRASTQEQAKYGNTVEAQIDMIQEYAKFNNYELKDEHIFVDRGKTGLNEKRPSYQAMLNLVYSGKVKTIIIKKSDRMSRNVKHREKMMEELFKLGVKIIGVEEHISWDTADDRETERIKAARHQGESERTGERTKSCLNIVVKSGFYPVRSSQAPFGYRRVDKRLVVQEKEAVVIRDIFNKIGNENYTVDKCLIYLRSNNIADRKWHLHTFMKLVKNPIYYGTLHFPFNNPRLIIPNHSPAIISEELFNLVQESMKRRRKINKFNYLCKDKTYCSCGKLMSQQSALKKIKGKRKKVAYLYYYCDTCKKRVNQTLIREKLIQVLTISALSEDQRGSGDNVKSEINKLERLILLYSDMFLDGQLELDKLEQNLKTFKIKLRSCKRLLKKIESSLEVDYYKLSDFELLETVRIKIDKVEIDFDCAKDFMVKVFLKEV